ncbi:MAG: polyprenyl synthetase family protein [Opitutaceae bacterium]|nr:polyprenyl synthetase family protein [Opitutaceae bacterium]
MNTEISTDGKNFKTKLSSYQEAIEEAIDRLLPAATTAPTRIHEAMRYSMQAGGKRLRPVLVMATAEFLSAKNETTPAAVAIECIHTYSLIHDDLPAMDNGDLRRGMPTSHIQFDEATAILAGDALLTYAFTLLSTAYNAELGLKLIRELSHASGSEHLIGGQMEDILSENTEATPKQLEFIHQNKTAALLTSALVMGAILANANKATIATIREIGRNLGLAFQIIDDILDATSTTENLGKNAGSDATAHKNTYVTLFGLQAAREKAHTHTKKAKELCQTLTGQTSFLSELIIHLENRIN